MSEVPSSVDKRVFNALPAGRFGSNQPAYKLLASGSVPAIFKTQSTSRLPVCIRSTFKNIPAGMAIFSGCGSGDTTPCELTPVAPTPVILHGVASPEWGWAVSNERGTLVEGEREAAVDSCESFNRLWNTQVMGVTGGGRGRPRAVW